MRILYFSQFYKPENIAASFRATEHASYWHDWGHDVTVFTGWPNYPTRKLFPGYVMRLFEEFSVDGVRVLRSKQRIGANTSLLKRAINDGSYLAYGIWNGLTKGRMIGKDYDVVLASSGTIFNGVLGAWYARRIGVPLVIEFRDLTYKQMVATGSSEDGRKVRLMKRLELALCKGAAEVVVLTDGFERTLASEGISASKMEVIPNGADIVTCDHSWSDRLRLGYFGTMGISQEVTRNVRYAKALYDMGLLESYELIGEGAAYEEVEDIIASDGYDFVSLGHGIPKDQLEVHYAEVDMTVVSLQKTEGFLGTIPSKIFQSFARGVPVLFVGPDGEAARIVRESGAGINLCGTEDEDLESLVTFASDCDLADRLEEMSAKAIDFMERNYTRRRMAERMLDVFERAAKAR